VCVREREREGGREGGGANMGSAANEPEACSY